MKSAWVATAAAGVLALVGWVAWDARVHPRLPKTEAVPAMRIGCFDVMRMNGVAFTIYAGDHDDRFPPATVWTEALEPYTKNASTFHCPAATGTAWGYAFNSALDLAKMPKSPEKTPVLYDSTDLRRDAADALASLPATLRHGMNSVAYADGSVRRVPGGVRP